MFKVRPKARIKIGQHFMGAKTSTTAEGVAVYKEWDATDKTFYYWEEWELRGFNDIDSWIEYDHYSQTISLYEPIRRAEKIDPRGLVANQTLEYQDGDIMRTLQVKEAGSATLETLKGTVSYHIFPGDTLEYAELFDIKTPYVRFAVERYNDNEYDMYRATTLSRAEQKRILGKVVAPIPLEKIMSVVWAVLIGGMIVYTSLWPHKETVCTPRTVTSTTSPSSSLNTTTEQNCQTRTVYGFGSGGSGGSGVGK